MHGTASIALALVLSLGALTPSAGAQTPTRPVAPASPQDREGAPGQPPNASQRQRDRIAQLRLETSAKLAPLRERLRGERRELQALWSAAAPSRDAILKKLASIDAIRAAIRPVLVDSRIAYLALLTPEQRKGLNRPCQPMHHGHGRPKMGGMDGHERKPGPCSSGPLEPWPDCLMDDAGSMGLDMDALLTDEPAPPPAKAPSP
jgi:Spy/CpxP family protein refolding chaperone